ncbi:hypothetical protein ACFLR0_00505 [Candidatus Bipolaricaulota bacterium]
MDAISNPSFLKSAEQLQALELEFDAFRIYIEKIPAWERIRHNVFREIHTRTRLHGLARAQMKRGFAYMARRSVQTFRNLIIRNPFLSGRRDIMFFGSPRRRLEADGLWWDPYCDPVIDGLRSRSVCLEQSYQGRHRCPAKTAELRYLDSITGLAAIRRRLCYQSPPIPLRTQQWIIEMETALLAAFGVSIDLLSMLRGNLAERATRLPIYERLLRRIRPKAVVLVISYGKETLIEACKKLRIPVVELQHGMISDLDFAYSYPGAKRRKVFFPDFLFVFGDYWKRRIEYPIANDKVLSIGYPYLEQAVGSHADVEKKQQALFISQGTIGIPLSRLAAELAGMQELGLSVVYKLHPGEYGRWRTAYPWLANSRARVIEGESSVYQLFAESQLQVGVYSTALFEGLAFGLPTVLVDIPGVEYVRRLHEEGHATLAEPNAEALLAAATRRSSPSRCADVFRPGSAERMGAAIEQLAATGSIAQDTL